MELVIIILALAFAVINGFHDGCNVIATIVSSRSMRPRTAIGIACTAEFIGAISLGTAVALTLGKGILSSAVFDLPATALYAVLLGALTGGILWNLITWFLGLPSSSSHALIGGLMGGGLMASGLEAVLWHNLLIKVLAPLLLAPPLGFVGAFLLMKLLVAFLRNFPPRVNVLLKKIQLGSMVFLAASHGSNDAQKIMGIIALTLAAGAPSAFLIPHWVVFACAGAMALGLSFGGWKIIKTIDRQVSKMTPLHSLDSQLASGLIVYASSLLGFPVSTTQISASSVMGAGAGYRMTSVRWSVTKNILSAWLITIPASAALSALIVWFIQNMR
ncbi:MAG: inorganic phosphate transporter [Verrucomicrobia bacterium]|nr:inorganic phosphate transporter [Verrucomicrobiota bacterium]MCG2679971.1 inorganic phosphate transporter [Kiritimatiellia bacterium]MBU4247086.1 inorganic phosphate transporter [Verrucomicrobiota bacterium]MBU4290254.1 inorganic phosphate transporter [Verrucomicrobiota bacterium]MBU4429532.1 inorganic phosphate transporter [Verrucomicrobiota bacterium]